MARKLYPTDLSERQWHLLKPLIPAPQASGRPRTVDLREIVNAIFYVLASGCAWRLLPHDGSDTEVVVRLKSFPALRCSHG